MSDDKLTLEQVQQAYGQIPTFKEAFYDFGGANQALFETINNFHSPNYDDFMLFVTKLGDHHFFAPYAMVLGLYALITLLAKKILRRGGIKQQVTMWIGAFAVMAAAVAAYSVIGPWIKDYFAFPRPYMILHAVTVLEPQERIDDYRSLPSGHVVFFSIMVFSLWPLLSSHMKMLGLFLIFLVGWSRVALGVHFPADALWGCALGFSIAFCTRIVVYTLLRKIFGMNCGAV